MPPCLPKSRCWKKYIKFKDYEKNYGPYFKLNNINNRISIIKIISIHYFFLIKQDQQFVYNFYSWKLIIKQQDILINRIIGLIPNWIINLNQEITKYRIAHPWKYRGIKLSIITLLKLIGLGFLLPYYGVVKVYIILANCDLYFQENLLEKKYSFGLMTKKYLFMN